MTEDRISANQAELHRQQNAPVDPAAVLRLAFTVTVGDETFTLDPAAFSDHQTRDAIGGALSTLALLAPDGPTAPQIAWRYALWEQAVRRAASTLRELLAQKP